MKKSLTIAYFVFGFMLFATVESFAYLDPSTSTYIIQIVAGGIIAAGTAVGIYFHKLKKAVAGKKDTRPANTRENNQNIGEGKTLTAEDILSMASKKEEK